MEKYQVSARKYRPKQFEELLGQQHIATTLINAIKNQQLGQSFLFCGPRGVGKTSCARILAQVMNTDDPAKFVSGESEEKLEDIDTSLSIFELDAASNNGVEEMRELTSQVRMAPASGQYKVYIIDEVHMLSSNAFNAFLKTLEEPPPFVIFILATTEKHKIIPTILSRCQVFDFKRISIATIVDQLNIICKAEKVKAEPEALRLIAEKADGAMRDALTIFDRLVNFSDREITYEEVMANLNILDYDYFFKMTDHLMKRDASGAMTLYNEILQKGFEGEIFIQGFASHFRNLLVSKDPEMHKLLEVGEQFSQRYKDQATIARKAFLLTGLNLLNKCALAYKAATNKRLQIELAILKMCHINDFQTGQGLAAALTGSSQKKSKVVTAPVERTSAVHEVKPTYTPTPEAVKSEAPKTAPLRGEPKAHLKVANEPSVENLALVSNEEQAEVQVKEVEVLTKEEDQESNEAGDQNLSSDNTSEEAVNKSNDDLENESAKDEAEKKIILEPKAPLLNTGVKSNLFEMDLSLDTEMEEEDIEDLPPLAQGTLLELWNKHVITVKTKRTRDCCDENKPKLSGDLICFEVSNSIDESHVRVGFTTFLEKLVLIYPNQDFNLKVDVVTPDDDTPKTPYTNTEKYDALVAKNPKLDELRRRMGLKIDY